MIYAIISDIHANMEALNACLDEIDAIRPDRLICLGDLVDYCAEPNEAIDAIKSRCDVVILGNHDEGQYNYDLVDGYSDIAYATSIHTRTVIKPLHVEYFKTLPYVHVENDICFVHASPCFPETYNYVLRCDSAAQNFKFFSEKICFIGHSHKPVIFKESPEGAVEADDGKLEPSCRYLINVGSVGQPRDGDPRASFGLYDSEKFEYRNIRVSYDIKSAASKIIREGLPAYLAERLFEGR